MDSKGKMFGKERLKEALNRIPDADPEEIINIHIPLIRLSRSSISPSLVSNYRIEVSAYIW